MQAKAIRANLIKSIREEQLFDARDHVLVAVSGGYDSMHLLRWLTDGQLPDDIQPTVSAAYINHQLRTDAADEERLVTKTFEQLGDRLANATIQRLAWEQMPTSGVEEQARDKRYEALIAIAREVGATIIVTAHHRGDQAETILYKMVRGSRLSQLTGMAPKQTLLGDIDIVRPLLDLEKAELPALVIEPVTEWIEDYTNQDTQFARNRLRRVIFPELREINQQTDDHLIDFSKQLAALQKLAHGTLNVHVKALEANRLDWRQDDDVLLLVMQTWLTRKHLLNVKDSQIRQVIQLMRNPNVNAGVVHLEGPWQLERDEERLILSQKS